MGTETNAKLFSDLSNLSGMSANYAGNIKQRKIAGAIDYSNALGSARETDQKLKLYERQQKQIADEKRMNNAVVDFGMKTLHESAAVFANPSATTAAKLIAYGKAAPVLNEPTMLQRLLADERSSALTKMVLQRSASPILVKKTNADGTVSNIEITGGIAETYSTWGKAQTAGRDAVIMNWASAEEKATLRYIGAFNETYPNRTIDAKTGLLYEDESAATIHANALLNEQNQLTDQMLVQYGVDISKMPRVARDEAYAGIQAQMKVNTSGMAGGRSGGTIYPASNPGNELAAMVGANKGAEAAQVYEKLPPDYKEELNGALEVIGLGKFGNAYMNPDNAPRIAVASAIVTGDTVGRSQVADREGAIFGQPQLVDNAITGIIEGSDFKKQYGKLPVSAQKTKAADMLMKERDDIIGTAQKAASEAVKKFSQILPDTEVGMFDPNIFSGTILASAAIDYPRVRKWIQEAEQEVDNASSALTGLIKKDSVFGGLSTTSDSTAGKIALLRENIGIMKKMLSPYEKKYIASLGGDDIYGFTSQMY